jgi:ACS family tartrate transporter-like MFS transporter
MANTQIAVNGGLPDPDVAARARHRIARRLLPFVFVLYIANYLDRANLAYAALEMSHDLRLSDRVFGVAAGIFFIGYLGLQIPGALFVERWSARKWLSTILITWGALTALTALVHSAHQLYAARFFLGVAEAGFFPGVIVYLTHWFCYEDRAKAVANFMAAIPVSFIIGSPVAGALLGVHWLGFEGWRWLFILEGIPAALLGIAALFYLTDRPEDARWLPPEEREWIATRLRDEGRAKSETQSLSVFQTLRSLPVLLLALVVLCEYSGFYAFIFWFPTMLKRLSEMSNFRVGLLGALPYIGAFLAMQAVGWNSDRTRERRWHAAGTQFLAAAALLVLILRPPSLAWTITVFTLAGIGMIAFLPPFWALPSSFLKGPAAAASIGFINALGSMGGFIGPYAIGYLRTSSGSFNSGLGYMALVLLLGGLIVLFCRREQKSRFPGRENAVALPVGVQRGN